MEHGVKECKDTIEEVKELSKDDLPFSLAFKTELNFWAK